MVDTASASAVRDPVPFLIAAGEQLAASLDFDQVLACLLDTLVPALADSCSIHLLDESGRFQRIAARHPSDEAATTSVGLSDRYMDDGQQDGPIHRLLAEGTSLLISPMTVDGLSTIVTTPERLDVARDLGLTSLMVVPLAARGRRFGVLSMGTAVRAPFEEAHLELAEEISRRAALALDTARLYGAVHQTQLASERARQRMTFLAEASAALAGSLDIHTTLQTVAELATRQIAECCSVALLEDDGAVRRVAVAHANPDLKGVFGELGAVIPMGEEMTHPMAGVLRTGVPYLNNAITEATKDVYATGPYRETLDRVAFRAGLALPLEARGRRIGVLNLGTSVAGRTFDEDDVALGLQLASRAALAIDNARLYGAASDSQRASERARRRMAFLAEASATLARSLDIRTTLQSVAELASREIAESCAVALVGEDGSVRRVAIANADPSRIWNIDEQTAVIPVWDSPSHPIAYVLETGLPHVDNAVTDESQRAFATGPYLEFLQRLAFRARLIVPMEVQGRRIGTLTLATSEPNRAFDADDIALGVQLGSRAALAIDNARLYQDACVANDRLAEQFELSDAVLRNIAEAIMVVDGTWHVTYVNPVAEQLLGQPAHELIGRDSHAVAHVADLTGGPPPGHNCHIRDAVRTGTTVRLEGVRFYCADGQTFPADVTTSPLMRDGRTVGAVTIFRDVSDRLQHREALERSEERLRRALDSAGMVMWERDYLTGRIVRSDLASTVYGRPNEELIEDYQEHDRLVHPEDRASIRAMKDATFRDGIGYEAEYRVLWPDGTIRWVSSRANAFRDQDGRPIGISGTTYDITKRKEAELDLSRLLDERQAEAAELRAVHGRLQQSLEALLGLHDVGKLLMSSSDLDAAGRRILEIAVRAARLQAATLRRRTSNGRTRIWQHVGHKGGVATICEGRALVKARARTLGTGQPTITQVECRSPEPKAGLRTAWCVPLVVKGDVIGVLEAIGARRPADEPTLEILGSIALQAATALESARLYREVAHSERALHGLVHQLMVAQEDERRRLAYEIHDGFAQMAYGVKQLVEAYAHDFPSDSQAGRHRMNVVIGLAQQTVSEIRRVLAGMRPTVLDDFGLARGLRAYADGLTAERLTVAFSESVGVHRLPATMEIAVFRLAQEALANVRRHANVDHAELRLERHGDNIVLEVQDRGCGFDLTALAQRERPGEHLGLLSMRERIAQVNGTLEIRSRCGEGTLVRAIVPLTGYPGGTTAPGGTDEQTPDTDGRRRRP